jgi:tRNA dimethylallyltransferase
MVSASSLKITPILTGPTASGKTALGLELARRFAPVEIINADSLCVYRGMDIGTAKPTAAERGEIRHHLIDIREPDQEFTAGDFVRFVHQTVTEIHSRGARALILGGSGFYLRALRHGLWEAPKAEPALRAELEALPMEALYQALQEVDSEAATKIGPRDRYRLVRAVEIFRLSGSKPSDLEKASQTEPDPQYPLWVIDRDPKELDARIALRTRNMMENGFLEEARALHERFPGARPLSSVGYYEAIEYLEGRTPAGRKIAPGLPGLASEIELATRQLSKKQRKWFRSEPGTLNFTLERDQEAVFKAFEGAQA